MLSIYDNIIFLQLISDRMLIVTVDFFAAIQISMLDLFGLIATVLFYEVLHLPFSEIKT